MGLPQANPIIDRRIIFDKKEISIKKKLNEITETIIIVKAD